MPSTVRTVRRPPDAVAATVQDWERLPADPDEALVANFLRGDTQRRFRLLCALRDTILAAAEPGREPAVGAVKRNWWRQEIARLTVGEPRHPLTRGLAELVPTDSPFLPWLEELAIFAESCAHREAPESLDELRLFCFRREGVTLTLAAAPHDGGDRDNGRLAAARHVGIAWGMVKITAALAGGQQLYLLPRDLVREEGLDGALPGTWPEQDGFRPALARITDAGLAELARAGADIRTASAVTAVTAAVCEAQLHARRRDNGGASGGSLVRSSGSRGSAHPLQLLWRAWRAARHQARMANTPDQEQP